MLSNAYLLAKFRFDTAENERNLAEILPKTDNYPTDLPQRRRSTWRARTRRWPSPRPTGWASGTARWPRVSKIGKISKFLQIFGGLVLGCTSYGARPQARAVNLSLMINLVWKIFENFKNFEKILKKLKIFKKF